VVAGKQTKKMKSNSNTKFNDIIQEQVATHTWNIRDWTLNWNQAGTDIHRAEDELMMNSCDSELVSMVTDEWRELRTREHMWRMKTKTNRTWQWLWQTTCNM